MSDNQHFDICAFKATRQQSCQFVCAQGAGASVKTHKAKLFTLSSRTALKIMTTHEKRAAPAVVKCRIIYLCLNSEGVMGRYFVKSYFLHTNAEPQSQGKTN